jgi:hypothetical protein
MRTTAVATDRENPRNVVKKLALLVSLIALFAVQSAGAQDQGQYSPPPPPPPANSTAPPPESQAPAPSLDAKQLDSLVARIALYPDPLLAQVLAASTYPDQIPDANDWANEHSNLTGDTLANAIREDNLQWDPSVIALLPFPSVLNMMAQDPNWTQQLGNAVLAQRADVMDAVQRQRKASYKYGYLRTSPYDSVVDSGGYVEILPVNPAYIYVPAYDPYLVYGPPRPGFVIGGAIRFGPGIVIGAAFAPWGWGHPYFGWGAHALFFDDVPWGRAWVNRGYYAHPYAHGWAHGPGPRVERHEVRGGRR